MDGTNDDLVGKVDTKIKIGNSHSVPLGMCLCTSIGGADHSAGSGFLVGSITTEDVAWRKGGLLEQKAVKGLT